MHRRGSTPILAAAAYAVAVVYLSWPLVTAPASSLVAPSGLHQVGAPWARADLDLLVWILGWTSHALATQPWHLFQANVFHPAADTLAGSEHLLGLAPIAAPVFWLGGNAVLAYNVTVLVVVWLNAVCTFTLARAWGGSAAAAFVAGAAYAFAPHLTGSFIRLHVSAVPLFPLVLLLAWRAAREPRPRTLALLVVLSALQLLAGMYVAYELAALLLAFAPVLLVRARRHGGSGVTVLLALAVAALVLLPVGLPYLRLRESGGLPPFAEARALVLQNSVPLHQVLLWLGDDLTWPVVALAIVGLAWPTRRLLLERLGLLCVALLGVLLSAGVTLPLLPGTSLPGPYELAMRAIPGFASMRAPSRFLVLPLLALSVLAALGAARLAALAAERLRATRLAQVVLLAAAVALVVARAPARPLPLATVRLHGLPFAAHRWLRDNADGGAVLELPAWNAVLDSEAMRHTGLAMIGSTLHWLPLLNGYSGHAPDSARLLMTLAQRLPGPAAFADLCRLVDIRWVVVHFAALREDEPLWNARAEELGLEPVARLGDDQVYRVTSPCGEAVTWTRAMNAGTADTASGVALAPLAARDMRATVAGRIPDVLPARSHRWFWLDVTNDGGATWPGLAANQAGTVELQARWRDAASRRVVAEEAPIPLARDLAPGETVRAQVNALAPAAGDYVLELGLVQRGRGWFADLGGSGVLAAPVRVEPAGGATAGAAPVATPPVR